MQNIKEKPIILGVLLLLLILLALNSSITVFSVDQFGIFWAPFALFFLSLVVPCWLLHISKQNIRTFIEGRSTDIRKRYFITGAGMALMLLLVPDIYGAFESNPLPTKNSDVLQQMNHLFDRFVAGEQPYTNVTSILWKPFPVYMPLHWIPLGIGKALHIDVRWGGYIVFVLIYLYSLWSISKKSQLGIEELILLILVPFAYFKFTMLYCIDNIHTVFEVIILGYYLLLALGIYLQKHKIIILSLICIMLSRYTIVFFLPLLMYVLYARFGFKTLKKYVIWGGSAFILLYVLPFLVREPSILQDGLAYHNKFAVSEYKRLLDGKLPAILNDGSSFMLIARKWWQIDDPLAGINAIRLFQLIMSGVLTILLVVFYRVYRSKMNVFDFLLAAMGLYLIFFYCTAPFAYGYYWMGFHSYLWIVSLRILQVYKVRYSAQIK